MTHTAFVMEGLPLALVTAKPAPKFWLWLTAGAVAFTVLVVLGNPRATSQGSLAALDALDLATQKSVVYGDLQAADVIALFTNYASEQGRSYADLDEQNFRFATFKKNLAQIDRLNKACLLYTSPSPRDQRGSRMPSSA